MFKGVTDEELLNAAIAGNSAAFNEIVNRYGKLMYGLCYRILRNPSAAEEAVQESFIKLWKNMKEWKKELSSLSTWIYRITANSCIDAKRKMIRRGEVELDDNLPGYSDDKNIEKTQLTEFIEKLMFKLNDKERMAFNVFYKEELKQAEIAKIMNISVKAVESNIYRGKQKLKELIEKKNIKLEDFSL